MPFGPINGPFIFIWMMFNINGEWQAMDIGHDVVINVDTNTKVIVDVSEDQSFMYVEAQFTVAAQRWLSFSLTQVSVLPYTC